MSEKVPAKPCTYYLENLGFAEAVAKEAKKARDLGLFEMEPTDDLK